MAIVLPPVASSQPPQSEVELKSKLAQLRLLQVDGVLSDCNLKLDGLRDRHVRNEQGRQDAQVREQERTRRREAKQERIRMRHVQATKIQAAIRSYLCRKFVVPHYREAKDAEELRKSRIALTDSMLGLHQGIHDLAFLEEDQRKAATRVQAWWRGVLSKRVVAIVIIRKHLYFVSQQLAQSATQIQAIIRGRQARMGCFRLRQEKEKRMQQAQKLATDRKLKAVIKIQSQIRRLGAIKETQGRRVRLAKDLEGDGRGTPTNETRDRGEGKSKSSDRNRRKRNPESHGERSAARKGTTAHSVHQEHAAQALAALEGGSMIFHDSDHTEQRQKSNRAMGSEADGTRSKKFEKKKTRM